MCVVVCLHVCLQHCIPEQGVRCPGTGVIEDCELPCGSWETNSGLLEDQPVPIDIHSWAIPWVTRTLPYINPVLVSFWRAGTKWFHSNNDSTLPFASEQSPWTHHCFTSVASLGFLILWNQDDAFPDWFNSILRVGIPKREIVSKTAFLTRSRRA